MFGIVLFSLTFVYSIKHLWFLYKNPKPIKQSIHMRSNVQSLHSKLDNN